MCNEFVHHSIIGERDRDARRLINKDYFYIIRMNKMTHKSLFLKFIINLIELIIMK
jgi:hypothetical protein